MDKLGHVRIDDRLIHGQIVAAWIDAVGCNEIVIADDKAAGDDFAKSLLKMACPPSIKLRIRTIESAAKYLTTTTNRAKILLILRDVDSALRLTEYPVEIDHINVGNASSANGRKRYTKAVWLSDEEVAKYKQLHDRGIQLTLQIVPSDHPTDMMGVIAGN